MHAMEIISQRAETAHATGPAPEAQNARVRLHPIRWDACTRRFARNLAALDGKVPEPLAISRAWDKVKERLQLFRDGRGNYHVAETTSGSPRFLYPVVDHRSASENRPLSHGATNLIVPPYLFGGLGYGWHFRKVYEATRCTFHNYSAALFIVEPDPALMAVALQLYDWAPYLADERVYLFLGPTALRDFELTLLRDPDLPIPAYCVRSDFGDEETFGELCAAAQRSADRRQRLLQRWKHRVERQYADRDGAYWSRRFRAALEGSGPPLRILSSTSRQTTYLKYSMRDASEAFAELGHECRVLIEPTDHHTVSGLRCLMAMADMDPDLFFSIDHLRSSHEHYLPERLPLFTWDQDFLPHIMTSANIGKMGSLDLLGGLSKLHCVLDLKCAPRRYCSAVIPTNPRTYDAVSVSDDALRRYACDMSYVSNASQTPKQFHDQERARMPTDEARSLLDVLYERVSEKIENGVFVGGDLGRYVLDEAEVQTGVCVRDPTARGRLVNWYLWRLADRWFRHQALAWASEWAIRRDRVLHLYGKGWDRHPTLHHHARGVARNGHELRCIYQASRINLQLMPAGFIHQRALDGLAAGGFFITRHTPADTHPLFARRLVSALVERRTSDAAPRAASRKCMLEAIDQYNRHFGGLFNPEDPRSHQRLLLISEGTCAADALPRFDEIAFATREEFETLAGRFMDDAKARRDIAEAMRAVVIKHFTYDRTMDRFLQFCREYFAFIDGPTGIEGR